jgi:hypothetical protein
LIADKWVESVWDPTREDDPDNKRKSVVPLSDMALKIIESVPTFDADRGKHEDFVFSLNGRRPMRGWSVMKVRLDKKMKIEPWQQRDLRRTAKTLMARAGVPRLISEHCLGHTMPTIGGTYDRHGYVEEKRVAFEKLAKFVAGIVNTDPNNVVNIIPAPRKRLRAKGRD